MQQILAGMNELNERVQNGEARATEAERRQAHATQQELARSQAGVKGKGKNAAVYNRSRGSTCLRRSISLKGEDDNWREWTRVFRSWSGRFFGGAVAAIRDHGGGHRNGSATIIDLALTSLRLCAGLLRKISTELYHVLVMLTRGRAQMLLRKAAEPEELEAYRLHLRRSRQFRTLWICWQPRLVVTHGLFDRFLSVE